MSSLPRPLLLLALSAVAAAQGSRADYARADGLRDLVDGKVLNADLAPRWVDGARFWYRHATAEGWTFMLVDAGSAGATPAFDHERVAAGLAAALGKEVAAHALELDDLEFAEDELSFTSEGHRWTCSLPDHDCTRGEETQRRPGGRGERRTRGRGRRASSAGPWASPDGRLRAEVREHDLWLVEGESERRVTSDGTAQREYGSVAWAPDSVHFVFYAVTPGDVDEVYFIETAPEDQLEAKLHSQSYARPGDRFPTYAMHLWSADAAAAALEVEPIDFSGPPRLRWSDDATSFAFEKRDRGHQRDRIFRVDVASGEARVLLDEETETFIDHYHKAWSWYSEDGTEILWASERDGWNHLYLYDGVTGGLKNQVTRGDWLVRGVDRVDEPARRIWFRASGVNPDEDPYHEHHYAIDFDGTDLVALTEGDGTHRLAWSPDRSHYLDSWSRVDQPPVHELRRADGALVLEVVRADASALLATGLRFPEVLRAKGRDGETDIWGLIHRPSNFDPNLRYAVIEDIYAGPHDSHVPKSFRSLHRAQAMAELGFVVVQIDGMGTNNRSKAFLDVCWQNIADAGFPDRIAWIRAAAARYPYLDLGRVGIHGVSAGGQSALGALLFHGDFYHAAVSSCGCHDNRLDKASWNEQWMGFPVGPHYEAQSNVTHAKELRGDLMLILGEMDTNVPPESTWRVVDELIGADKDFDLVVVPGAGHGGGGGYGERRRRDFFVRRFLGLEPRWE